MALDNTIKSEIESNINKWLNDLESHNDPNAKIVDFDVLWQWAGYGRNVEAKRAMQKYLVVDVDFCAGLHESTGGRPREHILLTLDAAKMFLMMAPTPKGREVRLYFIDAEKKWRLLKTNVENGRIRIEDKVTGQVIDNPLQDDDYVTRRYDCAVVNAQKTDLIQQQYKKPLLGIAFDGLISKIALGERPRRFLVNNNLTRKRLVKQGKNKEKGVMRYPKHPNGRDVMTKGQLALVYNLEEVAADCIRRNPDPNDAFSEFKQKVEPLMNTYSCYHGKFIAPTDLDEVKQAFAMIARE